MIEKICVDFTKNGLYMFFKDYQVETFRFLLINDEQNSGDIHKHLLYISEIMISRASVINFLERMEMGNLNILTYTIHTGKGGHHKKYSMLESFTTEQDIINHVERLIMNKILSGVENL